jgi:hypothetical protein
MTKKTLAFRIARAIILLLLAGFALLEGRSYALREWGVTVSSEAYQYIVLVVLFIALWLGTGDLIRDLRDSQKKRENT